MIFEVCEVQWSNHQWPQVVQTLPGLTGDQQWHPVLTRQPMPPLKLCHEPGDGCKVSHTNEVGVETPVTNREVPCYIIRIHSESPKLSTSIG